ncbi:hypothetical protein [Halomonas cupida]|uniref:hypothetical protein n=1 Tax=Halomonas cupida TaxID=44933 RepID=UPI003A8CBA34
MNFKSPPSISIILILFTTLWGCSTTRQNHSVGSSIYNSSNAGLIAGKMNHESEFGSYFEFRSTSTGKTYEWSAADDYMFWLPPGQYELSLITSREGHRIPLTDPFSFNVATGKINYIGDVEYGCVDAPRQSSAWYKIRDCGIYTEASCPVRPIAVCTEDKMEQTVSQLKAHFPSTSSMEVINAMMSRPLVE